MHEKIAIVQSYINHRCGVTVNIVIRNSSDLMKLEIAYKKAVEWFNENNGTIILNK